VAALVAVTPAGFGSVRGSAAEETQIVAVNKATFVRTFRLLAESQRGHAVRIGSCWETANSTIQVSVRCGHTQEKFLYWNENDHWPQPQFLGAGFVGSARFPIQWEIFPARHPGQSLQISVRQRGSAVCFLIDGEAASRGHEVPWRQNLW